MKPEQELDEMEIEHLLAGRLSWRVCGMEERKAAALILRHQGEGYDAIMAVTHLNTHILKTLFAEYLRGAA